MRLSVCSVALVALLSAAAVGQTEDPSPPAPTFRTTVRGQVPADIVGRWLAVAWMKLPQGTRSVPLLWAVTGPAGALQLTSRAVRLPDASARALAGANAAGQPWMPSAEDIGAVAERWDELRAETETAPLSVETEIVGRDAFDPSLQGDPDTRDALWVVRQDESFPKKAASIVQQIRVYAVREQRDGGYAGGFVHAATAVAPFLVPITFHGTFQLYRVPDAPRSLASRALDFLRGCGRR